MYYKTKEESLKAYKDYVDEHIANIKKGYDLFGEEIIDIVEKNYSQKSNEETPLLNLKERFINSNRMEDHDKSKYSDEELYPYAAKFYPCIEDKDNPDIEKNFELAWKHHYTHNDHHPEFWFLDILGVKTNFMMSDIAIVEMILDWISVSMVKKSSVYDWYISNRNDNKKCTEFFIKTTPMNLLPYIDRFMVENKDRLDFSK